MVSESHQPLRSLTNAVAVCEDAISVKNDKSGDQTWIIGGGAYKASDKVVQHNGCGTVNIIVSLFTADRTSNSLAHRMSELLRERLRQTVPLLR